MHFMKWAADGTSFCSHEVSEDVETEAYVTSSELHTECLIWC